MIPASTSGPVRDRRGWLVQLVFFKSSFRNLFCGLVDSRLCACPVRPHHVAWLQWMKPEWQIAWLQSPKIIVFTEAIARKYVHLRAQGGKRESRVLRSLFCKFKTLVSFPVAAAFAWLDQADLGLSRSPRPSPLDCSSASHATCSTRGAAPRRAARVPGVSQHSPGGSGQRRAPEPDYAKEMNNKNFLPDGLLFPFKLKLLSGVRLFWIVVEMVWLSTFIKRNLKWCNNTD